MKEYGIVIVLVMGIVYVRYQDRLVYLIDKPFLLGVSVAIGVGCLTLVFVLMHIFEKYTNKLSMFRSGIRAQKEKAVAYKFLPFDLSRCLEVFDKAKKNKDRTFIGLDASTKNRIMISIPDVQRTQHLQVLGMTGTGKSTSVFYPLIQQDAKKNRPIIIIDAKGEMKSINMVNSILESVGRASDLLVFSLSHKELSCSYNPLYVGTSDPQVVIDAFFSNFDDDNSFFREMSRTIFTYTFKVLHSLGKPFSPMDVYCYLNNDQCRQEINSSIALDNKQGHLNLKLLNQVFQDLHDQYKGWKHVIAGFNNYLTSFNDPILNEDDSDIVLTDVIENNKIVYYQLPTNAYPLQAVSIARIVQANLRYITSLIQTEQIRNDTLISVLIDEYGSFAEETFVEVLNKARSSRMMVTLAHQSLGDLENISHTFKKLIDENTLNKIYLKQSDPELAELIAKSIGTFTKEEKTYRMTAGIWGNQIHSGESSNKVVQEFYFSPDKIKSLFKYGQGYYIYKGENRQTCVNFGQFGSIATKPYQRLRKPNKIIGLELFEKYYLNDTQNITEDNLKVETQSTGTIEFDD